MMRIIDWVFTLSGGMQIVVLIGMLLILALVLMLVVKIGVALLDRAVNRLSNAARNHLKRLHEKRNPPVQDFSGLSEYQVARLQTIDPYLFSCKALNMPLGVSFEEFKRRYNKLIGEGKNAAPVPAEQREYFLEHGKRVCIARGWA